MKRIELEHVLRASACSDLHDIAGSKCVAGRDEDADRVRALLRHDMIKINRLVEPLGQLDPVQHPSERLIAWANRRAAEAATP